MYNMMELIHWFPDVIHDINRHKGMTTMSIIKRKKRDQFFIMSNHATQKDLISLSAIGLLAYIKSLPEDWTLYKTFLQKKFTRRTVDSAWKELVDKNYIAGFSCYVDRKKQYYYIVHDEKLTQEDFNEFIGETVAEIKDDGFEAKNIQPIKDCCFSVPEEEEVSDAQNVQHSETVDNSSDVQFVQYPEYSTPSTVPDEQIQIHTHKDISQINTNKEIDSVNTRENYENIIKDYFVENGEGLFDKQDIIYFTDRILEEMTSKPTQPDSYFASIIGNIVQRRKYKLGVAVKEVPFWNWLEN